MTVVISIHVSVQDYMYITFTDTVHVFLYLGNLFQRNLSKFMLLISQLNSFYLQSLSQFLRSIIFSMRKTVFSQVWKFSTVERSRLEFSIQSSILYCPLFRIAVAMSHGCISFTFSILRDHIPLYYGGAVKRHYMNAKKIPFPRVFVYPRIVRDSHTHRQR